MCSSDLDSDDVFETGPDHADSSLSLTTTGGCSCRQIIDSLDAKKVGHEKFGCPQGVIDNWLNHIHLSTCDEIEYGGGQDDVCVEN